MQIGAFSVHSEAINSSRRVTGEARSAGQRLGGWHWRPSGQNV
jgi:hypothetical protein